LTFLNVTFLIFSIKENIAKVRSKEEHWKNMAHLLDVEDIIILDNYPHPSLVNTNTDALQQVFTTNAWKKSCCTT